MCGHKQQPYHMVSLSEGQEAFSWPRTIIQVSKVLLQVLKQAQQDQV